jgi:hypothetical protein
MGAKTREFVPFVLLATVCNTPFIMKDSEVGKEGDMKVYLCQ